MLVVVASPATVRAQEWLADRARAEGPGFRLGDFELHPGVGVEVGYDSNLYATDGRGMAPVVDTGILRATAHVMVATRGAQRRMEGEGGGGAPGEGGAGAGDVQPTVAFRGGLTGAFYYFFADPDRTNVELDSSLALQILPGRPFSISIADNFGRSVRPFAPNTSTTASYARIRNDAALQLNFATPGDVLRVGAGYDFALDFFEDSLFQYGNNFRHNITLSEHFRFLPETAIVHDTTVSVLDYFSGTSGAPVAINDGVLLRSRVGLNGAITTNFSVVGMVGYGAGFYSSSPALPNYDMEYESVIAQAEARWQISPSMRLVFGYDRDFQPSVLGNFFRRDRGYANYQVLFDRSLLIGANASFGYYEFGAIVRPDGSLAGTSTQRGDFRLIASVFGEYRFTDWLGVNATLQYTGNFTDFQYLVDSLGMASFLEPAQFSKFEAWGGVRVFY
jgi:hypothetical protein